MTDVFLSYRNLPNRRRLVARFATILRAYGISVWWDYGLEAGASYREQIERELAEARVVIPFWCEESVVSEWVLAEAEAGKHKLVPVRLQSVRPPDAYEALHSVHLEAWNGSILDPVVDSFIRDLCDRLGKSSRIAADAKSELARLPPVRPLPPQKKQRAPRARVVAPARGVAAERQTPISPRIVLAAALGTISVAIVGYMVWRMQPPSKSSEVASASLVGDQIRSLSPASQVAAPDEATQTPASPQSTPVQTLPSDKAVAATPAPSGPGSGPLRQVFSKESSSGNITGSISADGKRVAVGGYDGRVRVYDVTSGNLLRSIKAHTWVQDLAFSSDASLVTSWGTGQLSNATWDISSGEQVSAPSDREGAVTSDDGKYYAKCETVFDAKTGAVVSKGAQGACVAVFSPDSTRYLVASMGSARLVDTQTAKELWRAEFELGPNASNSVNAIGFNADGSRVAVGFLGGAILVRDAADGTPRGRIDSPGRGWVDFSYSRDGKYLAVAREMGNPSLLNASTGALVQDLGDFGSRGGWIAEFAKDGKSLLVVYDDRAAVMKF